MSGSSKAGYVAHPKTRKATGKITTKPNFLKQLATIDSPHSLRVQVENACSRQHSTGGEEFIGEKVWEGFYLGSIPSRPQYPEPAQPHPVQQLTIKMKSSGLQAETYVSCHPISGGGIFAAIHATPPSRNS
jgi:hypothetical protein